MRSALSPADNCRWGTTCPTLHADSRNVGHLVPDDSQWPAQCRAQESWPTYAVFTMASRKAATMVERIRAHDRGSPNTCF